MVYVYYKLLHNHTYAPCCNIIKTVKYIILQTEKKSMTKLQKTYESLNKINLHIDDELKLPELNLT